MQIGRIAALRYGAVNGASPPSNPSQHPLIGAAIAAIAALSSSGLARAAPPALLTAPDPHALDFFGNVVTATPERIVTGYSARYPALKGRIFSFARDGDGWILESEWATNWSGDALGSALAAQGDLVVAGAPFRKPNLGSAQTLTGRAHILAFDERGDLDDIYTQSGSIAGDAVGTAVAIDGTWAVFSAPGLGGAPNLRFVKFEGTTVAASYSWASAQYEDLGRSVALADDWAAASSAIHQTVFILRRQTDDSWTIAQSIEPDDPTDQVRFSLALAMRGDALAIGAPAPGQDGELARGTVAMYRRSGEAWIHEQTLEAPITLFCEGFGRSVALGEDSRGRETLAVGAVDSGAEGGGGAAVFMYRRTNGDARADGSWSFAGARTGAAQDDFGASLAFSGSQLVIGAPGAMIEGAGDAAGALWVVESILADLNGDGVIDGSDLAILLGAWGPAAPGVAPDLNGDGAVDGSDLAILLGSWS